ncbi:protein sel-1 homolog 1-like isoform X3 [Oscarella lobularis]|uniref:protein sel-1 homolog 1-like isoform X3 n=1 Tax=Oscarella lobularis TaxID=121494 RepID=UPI003314008A
MALFLLLFGVCVALCDVETTAKNDDSKQNAYRHVEESLEDIEKEIGQLEGESEGDEEEIIDQEEEEEEEDEEEDATSENFEDNNEEEKGDLDEASTSEDVSSQSTSSSEKEGNDETTSTTSDTFRSESFQATASPATNVEKPQSESEVPAATSSSMPVEGDNNKEEGEEEDLVPRRHWTDEELEEGQKLCAEALELFDAKVQSRKTFDLFKRAAKLGNATARGKMAFAHLFGDHVKRNFTAALQIFEELAREGEPVGQMGLGFMHAAGIGVNSSQSKSLVYYTFSALGGDTFSQMIMGYRYWSGITLVQGCESSLLYFRKVAQSVAKKLKVHGGPVIRRHRLSDESDSPLAKLTEEKQFDEDLLQYHAFLAGKGDTQAALILGQLYYEGSHGVEQNFELSYHYFKLVAKEAQNALAYAFLGKLHSEGAPNVEQNDEKAFQYFRRAATEGNVVGLCGLGQMYLQGRGVQQDVRLAVEYLAKSAEQGWPEAQVQLGILFYSGQGVSKDYRRALKHFNLASQSGNLVAFYNLAQMHAEGAGTVRACSIAVELYKNVAERGPWSRMLMEAHDHYKMGNTDTALLMYLLLGELGYEVAQSNAAYILDKDGSEVVAKEEVYSRALLHWNRAASQGYSIARLKIGDYHYYGHGTKQDYEAAALHYRLASDQLHNAQAMFNLAYMHEHGLGLKQDFHLAKRYYDMAASSSWEAVTPTSLALAGLNVKYFFYHWTDYLQFAKTAGIDGFLGQDWDLYAMAILGTLLGLVLLIRQAQQQQQEERERQRRIQRAEEERRQREEERRQQEREEEEQQQDSLDAGGQGNDEVQ